MAVTDDAWASLLPDLLLEIFCRLETTAVVRCAAACKPWRRIIISNASSLRPCPDRYNPNLLLGFINRSWYHGIAKDGSIPSIPPPPAATSVITIDTDTGCCEKLSSFITPAFSADIGIGISLCYSTLTSRDGFLLLRRHKSIHDGHLCLYNPMAGDCKFLPAAPIMEMEAHGDGKYVLLTRYDFSRPGTSKDDTAVRILAMPRRTTYDVQLTYQVFCCSDDRAAVWGPVQRSSQVNKDFLVPTYGGNTVVSREAVHWFGGTRNIMGCRITCTVGLDVYTGRAWITELPKQCQFYSSSTTPCALITSGNGRVSLLQPLPDHNIQVWVLDGEVSTMEWTMQHKIWIDKLIQPGIVISPASILGCNYPKVICPRSGLLFIILDKRLQLRIDTESGACQPVQTIGHSQYHSYDPYEMDWSTYISKMKIF